MCVYICHFFVCIFYSVTGHHGKITRCCYDLMAETHHDNTKSTHCRDAGALSLELSHRQGMQCNYEKFSIRTWPCCQSNCTLVSPGHRNYKSYLFLPNYCHKRHSFVRMDLRDTMFSFPSCIVVDSSHRLYHNLSRNHVGHQHVQNYSRNQLGCGTD